MKKLTIFLVGLITACSGINLFNSSEEQSLVSIASDEILVDEFIYAFNKNRSLDSVTSKKDKKWTTYRKTKNTCASRNISSCGM